MRYSCFYLLLWSLVLINNTSCHHRDEPAVTSARTVLVYIAGENSLVRFTEKNITEMKTGVKQINRKTDNLLIYIDDYSTPRLIKLHVDGAGNVTEETIKEYEEHNSVSSSVMKQVIDDAVKAYPADSYGLVLWSHGDGWIPSPTGVLAKATTRWWGEDLSVNQYMNISELKSALETAPHFSFIFFDACFMQSVEVVYQLRDCCDYYIGCPTEIPGPGANYEYVVPAFFDYTDKVGRAIAAAYYRYYAQIYDDGLHISNDNWTGGISVSAIKTGMLEHLASTTAQILPKYIVEKQTISTEGIFNYDNRQAKLYYYDMNEFIESLTQRGSDYVTWKEAFDQAVIYWASTPRNYSAFVGMFDIDAKAGGLSIFLPNKTQSSLVNYLHRFDWYRDAGWEKTGW